MEKKVEEVMSRSLQFIDEKASLQDAHDHMSKRNIRHLLIGDGLGKITGLISDRDVKKFISPFATAQSATDRDKATLAIEVGKIMTKKVITAKTGDKLKNVVEVMLQKRISGVPILDESGKGVGIITITDVLKLMLTML